MRVYHYTTGINLAGILNTGLIKLEGQAGQIQHVPAWVFSSKLMPCFAWFTRTNNFPATALPIIVGQDGVPVINPDLLMTCSVAGGFFRIEVDTEQAGLIRWSKHPWRRKNLLARNLKVFEKIAAFKGDNPLDWWVSETPVAITEDAVEPYWPASILKALGKDAAA
jgi:hypothetical protein